MATFYTLPYTIVAVFHAELHSVAVGPTAPRTLFRVLCDALGYDELSMARSEACINESVTVDLPWKPLRDTFNLPCNQASLLLQAHCLRSSLSTSGYLSETKRLVDQAMCMLQAMVDIAAQGGRLWTTIALMQLAQSLTQARWLEAPQLRDLPHVDRKVRPLLRRTARRAAPPCSRLVTVSECSFPGFFFAG